MTPKKSPPLSSHGMSAAFRKSLSGHAFTAGWARYAEKPLSPDEHAEATQSKHWPGSTFLNLILTPKGRDFIEKAYPGKDKIASLLHDERALPEKLATHFHRFRLSLHTSETRPEEGVRHDIAAFIDKKARSSDENPEEILNNTGRAFVARYKLSQTAMANYISGQHTTPEQDSGFANMLKAQAEFNQLQGCINAL